MRSAPWILIIGLTACGGADEVLATDAAATTDATGDPDAAVACPSAAACESAERSGVIYADGCAPVACGLWRYQARELEAQSESPSLGGLGPTSVAYVRTAAGRQVRMATFEGVWRDEHVAPVLAAGATQGTAMTRIGSAAGDELWVVWSEADGSVNAAHRTDEIIAPPWTVTRNLATGSQPVLATGSQPLLAYLGAGGIHVRTFDGAAWSAPTVVAGDAAILTATRYNDGFDNVLIAWRTPGGDVKFARSRNGAAFVSGDIETGLPANPNGASLTLGQFLAPVIVYSRDAETTVRATLESDGTWHQTAVGHAPGQGSGAGVTQSPRAAVAYTSAAGVHTVELLAGGTQVEQVVSVRCGHGRLLAGSYVTDPFLVHRCDDGSLYALRGLGSSFPVGWHERCVAVAGALGATARSCGTDDACVIRDGRSACGPDAAYAQVCGDPTVDPSVIDACEAAAPGVSCVLDGDDGTATVPAACLP